VLARKTAKVSYGSSAAMACWRVGETFRANVISIALIPIATKNLNDLKVANRTLYYRASSIVALRLGEYIPTG
jgi:hypothetical protein